MSTIVHFIDVEQGNMVLVQCADGTNFMVDCNITDANADRVLAYVDAQIGRSGRLRAFICTHRDADHMRGVRKLHARHSIQEIQDSGYPGTTTDSDEYREYMDLRRLVGSRVIEKQMYSDYEQTRFRYMSAKDSRLPDNANDQGIVLKVEHRNSLGGAVLSSTMLTGDGSFATWKDGILKDYATEDLACEILMAGHHGSLDFFDDPSSSRYFVAHIQAMNPAMTVVSVGRNSYGHPDDTALRLYRKYSRGSRQGNKILRTDLKGTIKLILKDDGGWSIP